MLKGPFIVRVGYEAFITKEGPIHQQNAYK